MRAQQPVSFKGPDSPRPVTRQGRVQALVGRRLKAGGECGKVTQRLHTRVRNQRACLRLLQERQASLGVADGICQPRHITEVAVTAPELYDSWPAGGGDQIRRGRDIGQHRPGLHRCQLVGVADQDQPGGVSDCLQQPRHQRDRHHGGLVHDHHFEGQRIERVVGAFSPAWDHADDPVQRPRGQCRPLRVLESVPHRGLQAGGRFAGGGR